MKKFSIILLLLIMSSIFTLNFEASSGKLKSASICTGDDGVTYGNHGDGHWHVAVKHDSGWYPQGSNLGYDNPCIKAITYHEEVNETEEVIEVINEIPALNLDTMNIKKFHSELAPILSKRDIIEMFNIKAIDKEDGDISDKINLNIEKIDIKPENQEYEINVEIEDSNNEKAYATIILTIMEREAPIIESMQDLTFDKKPSCDSLSANNYFKAIDSEGNNLSLSCKVDNKNKKISISTNDQYNMNATETFFYEVKQTNKIMNFFIGLVTLSGITLVMFNKLKK